MDQFAGLAPAAEKFLKENQRPPRICETCGHVTETYIEKCGTYSGMFMEEYPLHRYPLKGNRFADAFLQAAPWSGGPVHFLGLRLGDETEFIWTEEEMNEWL
jgi:hypothetical protein